MICINTPERVVLQAMHILRFCRQAASIAKAILLTGLQGRSGTVPVSGQAFFLEIRQTHTEGVYGTGYVSRGFYLLWIG